MFCYWSTSKAIIISAHEHTGGEPGEGHDEGQGNQLRAGLEGNGRPISNRK